MDGRANEKRIKMSSRIIILRGRVALIAVVILLALLCVRLAVLQLIDPDDYKNAAVDQYTYQTVIPAKRGAILASDGTTELAVSATVQNVFVSPYDIKDEAQLTMIADFLSRTLVVDRQTIINKCQNKKSKYQVIKKSISEAEELAIRTFVKENDLANAVNLEESTKRYYRYGSLAAHLVGFTGIDNNGLSGIEYTYDEYLRGTDGRAVKAQDGNGNELPFAYETYIDAIDGWNAVSTIDWTIQSIAEKYLKQTYEEHLPNGRAECLIMNVNNGEILASAVYPSYDLNSYTTLSDYYQVKYDTFVGTEEERAVYKSELLNEMWNNTIATQTYEPGSTFKLFTAAVALEEGVMNTEETVYCGSQITVGGTTIHCHISGNHGEQTLDQALVNSCNPAFVRIGTKIGAERFAREFDEFGYTRTTGSDILGEVSSIYYGTTGAQFMDVELAVYSFGQTFKVTPLQHLRAVSAIANGGWLVTPHVIREFTDQDGAVVKTMEFEPSRQVLSEETCRYMLNSLVNSTKNACVTGYNVVSKTGTSQKQDTERTDDYISSCVTFAPAEDPQIAIIVIVDDPTAGQIYGNVVAAPAIGRILTEVLPYMGIKPNNSGENEFEIITVDDYRGSAVSNAKTVIEDLGLKCVIKGDGDTVVEQLPRFDSKITENGVIVLYTGDASADTTVTVPSVIGYSPESAMRSITNSNLNVEINGIFNNDYRNCKVVSQTPVAGSDVAPGTVIQLEFRYEEAIE